MSLILPIAQAALGFASQGFNVLQQQRANREQKQFALDMYNRQRQDALADWNAQNLYNSPQQQMQRLKDAGLNPNLVYGTGAVGNASGQVRGTSAESYKPNPASLDLGQSSGNAITMYYDAQVKQQQVDNLKEAQKNMITDRALKEAKTNETNQNIIDKTWKLSKDKQFTPYQLDLLKGSITKQLSEINRTDKQADYIVGQIGMQGDQKNILQAQYKNLVDENVRKWMAIKPNIDYVLQKTKESVQDTIRKKYQNENMNALQQIQLESQIDILNQTLQNLIGTKEGIDLKNDFQRMINAGQDPRMISNMITSLFDQIPFGGFLKKAFKLNPTKNGYQ